MAHLLDTEDGRQGAGLRATEEVKDRQGMLQGALVEELEGTHGQGDGAGGDPFLVHEVNEVAPYLLLRDLFRRFVVVEGELLDGVDVNILRPGSEATELHVF